MSQEVINELRGLVFEYCNESKDNWVAGQPMHYRELNKPNYEKLSGFINWIEATSGLSQQNAMSRKPSKTSKNAKAKP
jgi:hypothetical protein